MRRPAAPARPAPPRPQGCRGPRAIACPSRHRTRPAARRVPRGFGSPGSLRRARARRRVPTGGRRRARSRLRRGTPSTASRRRIRRRPERAPTRTTCPFPDAVRRLVDRNGPALRAAGQPEPGQSVVYDGRGLLWEDKTRAATVVPSLRGFPMSDQPLLRSDVRGFPRRRGKVRDVYDLGDRLAIVATDRISAFDWVMPDAIPGKGRVLTAMTRFWLDWLRVPHHLLSLDLADLPAAVPGARRRARRPHHAGAEDARWCRSSAWPAATWPGPGGRSTGSPAPSAASRCRTGLQGGGRLPEADLHPGDEGRGGARRERLVRRDGRRSRRGGRGRAAGPHAGRLPAGGRPTRPAAGSSWPTRSSNGAACRPAS